MSKRDIEINEICHVKVRRDYPDLSDEDEIRVEIEFLDGSLEDVFITETIQKNQIKTKGRRR